MREISETRPVVLQNNMPPMRALESTFDFGEWLAPVRMLNALRLPEVMSQDVLMERAVAISAAHYQEAAGLARSGIVEYQGVQMVVWSAGGPCMLIPLALRLPVVPTSLTSDEHSPQRKWDHALALLRGGASFTEIANHFSAKVVTSNSFIKNALKRERSRFDPNPLSRLSAFIEPHIGRLRFVRGQDGSIRERSVTLPLIQQLFESGTLKEQLPTFSPSEYEEVRYWLKEEMGPARPCDRGAHPSDAGLPVYARQAMVDKAVASSAKVPAVGTEAKNYLLFDQAWPISPEQHASIQALGQSVVKVVEVDGIQLAVGRCGVDYVLIPAARSLPEARPRIPKPKPEGGLQAPQQLWAKAISLQRAGLSVEEMAVTMGVSHSQAKSLLKRAMLNEEFGGADPLGRLSVRSRNCLRAENLHTPQQVQRALLSGELANVPNMGAVSLREIEYWLKEEANRPQSVEDHKQVDADGNDDTSLDEQEPGPAPGG